MSVTTLVLMVLLGCSLGMAFILHPTENEPVISSGSPGARNGRCQGESLQAIRKALLRALNLQTEPQLPAGGLTTIREQWKAILSAITSGTQDNAVPAAHSGTPAVDNNTGLKCCQMATKIFLKDLGWDNWVIFPESFTYVQCAACNPKLELNTMRCPSHMPNAQYTHTQMPCCQSTSQAMVPFVYMDELSTVVISSVQLTRTCGCSPGNVPLPNEE